MIKIDDFIYSCLYVVIVTTFVYIFQNQIAWYTRQSYKNEQLLRIGMNAHNLIHEQNMAVHTDALRWAILRIEEGNPESAISFINNIIDMIDKHNRLRELLLDNYTRRDGLKTTVFELNELMEFLLQFEYLNHSPDFYLEPLPEYTAEDIAVKGNKYEIASLFQIIIDNAVEAMRKTGRAQHKLYVTFKRKKNSAVVSIHDTGTGFANAGITGKVDLSRLETSKKKAGGFGLVYVKYLIKQYKGALTIANHPDGGAVVKVELPTTEEPIHE